MQRVLSAQQFAFMARRERSRSDRNGLPFCIVNLRITDSLPPGKSLEMVHERLLEIVGNRLRITDDLGIEDESSINLLLPETPLDGAKTVTRRLRVLARREGIRLDATIHAHTPKGPSGGGDGGDDDDDNRPPSDFGPFGGDEGLHHRVDPPSDASCARAVGLMVESRPSVHVSDSSGAETTHRETVGHVHDGSGIESSSVDTRIAPMDEWFVQPIPGWKRTLDIVGALFGLTLAGPVILLAGLIVKWDSTGPMFFFQWRDGIGGRRFRIAKLRTMTTDAEDRKESLRASSEQDGPAFKLQSDPRVTTIGKVLRKTSLDELPQLWNVLIGDMSLVGPRPLPCDESGKCASWQRRRLDVTPGLTCIWQVEGRSRVSFADWIRMDLRYIRKRALFSDLSLLVRTIPAVVGRKGAH